MEKLVALHRNHSGGIISFETSDGRIISYRKAIQEAENGKLEDVQMFEDFAGNMVLVHENGQPFDQLLPDVY